MFSYAVLINLMLLLTASVSDSSVLVTPSIKQAVSRRQTLDCSIYEDSTLAMSCHMYNNVTTMSSTISKVQNEVKNMTQKVIHLDEVEKAVAAIEKDVTVLKEDIHPTVPACPTGFVHDASVKTSCYRLVDELLNWSAAGRKCHAIHPKAHLVVIDSKDKEKALDKLVKAHDHKLCRRQYVHGFRLAYWTAGQWVDPLASKPNPFIWRMSVPEYFIETTSPMKFTSWLPKKPDNQSGRDGCMEYIGGEGWNDIQCAEARCLICELDTE